MSKRLHSFVVGSSLPVTLWPLLGLAIADGRNSPAQLDFSVVGLVLPLVFGLANVLTTRVIKRQTTVTMFLVGALLGLGLASTGTFLLDIPRSVYHLEGAHRYVALLLGPVFYGLIWAFPLRFLNNLMV